VSKPKCAVCMNSDKPTYRPMCTRCSVAVPFGMRKRLTKAWQQRAKSPDAYVELVAEVRQWWMDHCAIPNEYDTGERDVDCRE